MRVERKREEKEVERKEQIGNMLQPSQKEEKADGIWSGRGEQAKKRGLKAKES